MQGQACACTDFKHWAAVTHFAVLTIKVLSKFQVPSAAWSKEQGATRGSISCYAAAPVVERDQPSTSGQADQQSVGFHTDSQGYMLCDSLRVDDIREKVRPAYLAIAAGASRAASRLLDPLQYSSVEGLSACTPLRMPLIDCVGVHE